MPRPTLLVGFGSYGLDALQRLLHQSALRGVLRWQETQSGGVASAQRQLRELALLALPDPFERLVDSTAGVGAGVPQFLTDLYRQIKGPPRSVRSDPEVVAQHVRQIADGLVSQTAFDRHDPVGLDSICLARPSAPDAIPHLDILLQHSLESLADSSFFKAAVQGAENLNCILVLDFEDYWQGAGVREAVATARTLRAALRNSMEGWERRRAGHQVALDRCYLVDGRNAVGYRSPQVRLDEAVLFLELLLFEGLRTSRQTLYQQHSLVQPVTATFGVRLLEEGTLVLSREAAATFGRRWLDALIGDQVQCPDRAAERVRETLAPQRWEAVERHLNDQRLEQLSAQGAEQLVETLMAVPEPQAADWLDRVRVVFERERLHLEQTLDRAGWEAVGAFKDAHLKDLDERLVAAVDADLHDARAPASLTLVRAALDEAGQEPSAAPDRRRSPAADNADPWQRLGLLHRQYRDQLDEWLASQGRALHWFWPLLALLLALGLASRSVRLVYQLNLSGLDWWDTLVNGLRLVNHPLAWTLLWFLCLWGILALQVQPLITGRIARAQRFYSSTQRGRFYDHIRGLVDPLRLSLLARVRRNVRTSLSNEVQKTLSRVADRLAERGREMDWLRRQLNEFLRLSSQPATPVRSWARGVTTLDTLMQARPLGRVCYPQDDLPRPFADWNQHFCDAFLDPLRFIDTLSAHYVDADEVARERTSASTDLSERQRELLDFIDHSKLAPACRFLQDTGVPAERRWSIAAQRWRNLPGMVAGLNDRLGIAADDIVPAADRARVYLLVVQAGIDAVNLERGDA